MSAPAGLLVSPSFLPGKGGIESYLAVLCSELAPHLAVLAPRRREGQRLPDGLGYPTTGRRGRMLAPSPRTAAAIAAAASAHATRKVLFGTPWPLVLTGPRLRRAGLSYAVVLHGAEIIVPAAVPGLRRALAHSLAGADLLLPVSAYTADQVRGHLERMGLSVPPMELMRAHVDARRFSPGVPTQHLRDRLGLGADDRVTLCLGRLVKRKGVDRLIRATAMAAARHPEVVLVVAGTGPEESKLKRLAARLGVRAVFAGRVPDEDAPAAYALAEVFALPVADRWFGLEVEGLGVVLLEAAACGVPCVTGRSGGTPEAVLDGITGFVVDGRRPEAVAGKMDWLLDNPGRARAMGRAGRDHVCRTFASAAPRALREWLGVR